MHQKPIEKQNNSNMKQVEKIWSEMTSRKEDLASQKVELATIKEISTMVKRAQSWESEINVYVMNIRDLIDDIDRQAGEARRDYSNASNLSADLERAIVSANAAAEELGINADSIKELSDGMEVMGSLDYALNELDEMLNAVKSI